MAKKDKPEKPVSIPKIKKDDELLDDLGKEGSKAKGKDDVSKGLAALRDMARKPKGKK